MQIYRNLNVINIDKESSVIETYNFYTTSKYLKVVKKRRIDYISLITDKMLPAIAEDNLADYCDVFCDRGFFTPEETDVILKRASEFGLKAKIHANELDYSGGIQIGVANNAVSVDHLEFTGDEEINVLKN